MTSKELVDAIRALVPAGFALYEGRAPEGATFPRIVLTHHLPGVSSRSEAGTAHLREGRVQVTIAGTSAESVRVLWDTAYGALEGARPNPVGWMVTPLRMVEDALRVYVDPDVTIPATNTLASVGVATFAYAVTPL